MLTRRGRLLRTTLIALLLLALIIGAWALLRPGRSASAARQAQSAAAATAPSTAPAAPGASAPSTTASASPAAAASPTAPASPAATTDAQGFVRTGRIGDGTWTVAAPVPAPPAPASGAPGDPASAQSEPHRYAVRVEGGTGLDADQAAREIAAILADPRGWGPIDGVSFVQVADPADADFTLSLATPPTVDELCRPARTGGLWSCRNGGEVALNADRWEHKTPTYADLAEYRAYMINHEVGHALGRGHERCAGEGAAAPVMLQQSMGLGGCRPNAWPARDGDRPGGA